MLPKLLYENNLLTALEIAKAIARDYRHNTYSGSHVLSALLQEDVGLAPTLEAWDIDIHYIRDWAGVRISDHPKSMAVTEEPAPENEVTKLMEFADVTRLKTGEKKITPLSVLIALCRPGIVYTEDELRSFPVTESELLNFALQSTGTGAAEGPTNGKGETAPASGLTEEHV